MQCPCEPDQSLRRLVNCEIPLLLQLSEIPATLNQTTKQYLVYTMWIHKLTPGTAKTLHGLVLNNKNWKLNGARKRKQCLYTRKTLAKAALSFINA